MNKDYWRAFVALSDFVLAEAELQSLLLKFVVVRFETLEKVRALQNHISNNVADLEKRALIDQLDGAMRQCAAQNAFLMEQLKDVVARGEFERDQIAAALNHLRKKL